MCSAEAVVTVMKRSEAVSLKLNGLLCTERLQEDYRFSITPKIQVFIENWEVLMVVINLV